MHIRRLFAAAGGFALVAIPAISAVAQNEAPFTIRRPQTGATVREKVRIVIPLASIPEGAYVAVSIDGTFREAVVPSDEQRKKLKPGDEFVYVWDSKKPVKVKGVMEPVAPADGEHEISVTLYAPKAGKSDGATEQKQTSSVKLNLANKTNTDPGAILLRYRYPDRSHRVYNRNGETVVVAGLTAGMQGADDQELVGQRSKLTVAVEDNYGNGSAMVRNKLTELYVRQNGQETYYPSDNLPNSLYQQLDPLGAVVYQNHSSTFDEFAQLGVPVETTLNLPKLPTQAIHVGDKWLSEKESLDIPGTPPDKQPKVSLESTFEGVEWEGGYPAAKIHQTYDSEKGGLKEKTITFGTTEVESPQLKFERDIYIAYRSGTLVKVARKMEVTGKTSQPFGAGGAPGGIGGSSTGGLAGGGGMMSGMMNNMMGGPGGPGGMTGGTGSVNMSAMMGTMMNNSRSRSGAGSMYGGGAGGGGGMMAGGTGRAQRGRRGGMGNLAGARNLGMPGGATPGTGGMPAASNPMMGRGGFPGAAGTQPANTQITLKSTLVTELARPEPAKTASRK